MVCISFVDCRFGRDRYWCCKWSITSRQPNTASNITDQICACAPALKTLLHYSRHRERLPAASPHPGPRMTDDSTQTTTSTKPGFLKATRSLALSSRSRSRKGSVKLEDHLLGTTDSWLDGTKTQAQVLCAPRLNHSDSSDIPVMGIMRRQSVELENMESSRPVWSFSPVSQYLPSSMPEEYHLTETAPESLAKR